MKINSSTVRSYSVPITIPTKRKIQIVSEYKKRKLNQNNNNIQNNQNNQNNDLINNNNNNKLNLTIPENSPAYEDGQLKLEQLYLKGQELRTELQSLNNVRSSLLWLLKKVNTLELQRNHLNNHSNNNLTI